MAATAEQPSNTGSPRRSPASNSRSSNALTEPRASSSFRNAGSSSEPSLGSDAVEDWPRIGSASIERRSPSSSSPPSASCCESYAIQCDVLGQTLSKLYERTSVIITTNLSFGEWAGVFGDAKMTTALLDRLTHRCHILETGNDSFRFKNSSARAAKPAKEKPRNLTNA